VRVGLCRKESAECSVRRFIGVVEGVGNICGRARLGRTQLKIHGAVTAAVRFVMRLVLQRKTVLMLILIMLELEVIMLVMRVVARVTRQGGVIFAIVIGSRRDRTHVRESECERNQLLCDRCR
jgi:hypothetical protein